MTASKDEHTGTLEVRAKIPFDQFYYEGGESDADTVKVEVESMRFSPNGKAEWIEDLHTFDDARIRGKKVIKDKKMTVRLQGIDAPELHYGTSHWFRQHWGAKAASELEKFVKPYVVDSATIDTYIYTMVEYPNDVFDIYARFVGDIILSKVNLNMNQWLVEKGWAFPTFYNSMTRQEISNLDAKNQVARQQSNGIWKGFANKLIPFDFDLQTSRKRDAERIDAATDNGDINLPKIFRRQVDYEVKKNSGSIDESSFVSYLKSRNDQCYLAKEFLEKRTNAQTRALYEFVDDENGNINFEPNELVFVENTSELLKDSFGNRIEEWI